MAVDASRDFAFLVAAARRSVDDLARVVEGITIEPGRRRGHFLDVVKATLEALSDGVADRESDFAAASDDTERRSVLRAMRLINHQVMGFHEITPWIESARGVPVGLGLTYLVDEIARSLLRQSADIVMTPSAKYMYWTVHKPFEAWLATAGIAYPAPVAPVIVAYPIQEPDSLFLHLLIAHELGHSAIREPNLEQEVYRRDLDPTATRKLLNTAVTEYMSVEHDVLPVARAKVRAIFRSWLTEAICDGVAVGLIGPPFVFSATAFITPFGGPEPSESHPPSSLRMKLLLERLDAWGWRSSLEATVPQTFSWIESLGARPQEAGHRTYFLRLEEAIGRLSDRIEAVVVDHLGGDRFEPSRYATQADELALLLENDILPAQLSDKSAPDRRAIILAGWLRAFQRFGDRPETLAQALGDREYQRFLTKALEMSAVLEGWNSL